MFLITEMYNVNGDIIVSCEEIESRVRFRNYYSLLLDGIKRGIDQRNWFNIGPKGYLHGNTDNIPKFGEFRNSQKLFVISQVHDDQYVCYTKDGVMIYNDKYLNAAYKNGCIVNANVSTNSKGSLVVRLNRGRLQKLPYYIGIDNTELRNEISKIRKRLKLHGDCIHNNIGVADIRYTSFVEDLFNRDGSVKDEFIIQKEKEYIHKHLDGIDLKSYCAVAIKAGINFKNPRGYIIQLAHKVVSNDMNAVCEAYDAFNRSVQVPEGKEVNRKLLAKLQGEYTNFLKRLINSLPYS